MELERKTKTIAKFFSMFILVFGVMACGEDSRETVVDEPLTEETTLAEGETTWNYENTNWEAIAETDCSSAVQSPVNIDTDEIIPAKLADINYEYEPFPMKIVDNGHTIQVYGTEESFITVEGKRYQFMQFHFHNPAEHTIDGKRYPLEMHLVHKEEGTDNLVVLGIFIEERGETNPILEKVFSNIPTTKKEERTTDVMLTLSDYIPPSQLHYTYIGSLTTPPCSVGVDWILFNEPIAASSEQIIRFGEFYADNARPLQNLNNRRVLKSLDQ